MPRLIESLPALPFEARKDVSQVSEGGGGDSAAAGAAGSGGYPCVQHYLANKFVQHPSGRFLSCAAAQNQPDPKPNHPPRISMAFRKTKTTGGQPGIISTQQVVLHEFV